MFISLNSLCNLAWAPDPSYYVEFFSLSTFQIQFTGLLYALEIRFHKPPGFPPNVSLFHKPSLFSIHPSPSTGYIGGPAYSGEVERIWLLLEEG